MEKIMAIMAATEEGVIGKDNKLPWDYPEELAYFKEMTQDHIIIMGRKTFDAMCKNNFLSNSKKLIVFSRTPRASNSHILFVQSLEEYFKIINKEEKTAKIFMIGGAEIAHLFLSNNLISSFFLTKIHHPYPGDTYLNLKYFIGWNKNLLKFHQNYTIFQLTSN